jgi:steroid delta-isomerase-like uncharacterized protein
MSNETNKATVRREIEERWNKHRMDNVDEFFTKDIVGHLNSSDPASGQQKMNEGLAMFLNAFPDIRLTIEDEFAEGDKVVVRFTMTGTHQGELLGIPPTGKRVSSAGVSIYRLANAKIAEIWFLTDSLTVLQQMGVVPALEAA